MINSQTSLRIFPHPQPSKDQTIITIHINPHITSPAKQHTLSHNNIDSFSTRFDPTQDDDYLLFSKTEIQRNLPFDDHTESPKKQQHNRNPFQYISILELSCGSYTLE